MSLNFKFILFLFAIIFIKHSQCGKVLASESDYDASVAVLDCSKKFPNVYFDTARKQWMVHGAESKCYSSEKDLYDLCRLVYPQLNVVNVMRADEPVKFTIYGCSNDLASSADLIMLQESEKLKNCSKLKTKNVVPYKCLYGEFQSRELYIPPKCQFQHLYSNDVCQSQDHWNLLSIEKCKTSNLALNSSMLLKWCDSSNGVATFSGIEFVCCPSKLVANDQEQSKQQLDNQQIINYFEDEDIDDDDVDANYDDNDDDDDDENTDPTSQDDYNSITREDMNQLSKEDITDVIKGFDLQLEEKSDLEAVEGTQEQKKQYEKQKQLIINSIQASFNTIAKEKETERINLYNRNTQVTSRDLDELNQKYEVRFNRLKEEKQRLLLQEETAYEQQVQGMLNEAKLNSVKELNKLIEENNAINKQNVKSVITSLYKLYIAQENDRLHMITVYKKLKAYFPDQLIERAKSIINHLDSIDRTMNQTTAIFVVKFGSSGSLIVSCLNEHFKRYESIRSDAKIIANELYDILKFKVYTTKSTNKFIKTDLTPDESLSKNYEYDADKKDDQTDDSDENDSSEENDSTDDFVEPEANDILNKPINIHQIKSNSGFPFAIIGICLGILSSLILIYIIIKRKRLQASQSIKHGFLPVETSNPEDRHLNNMQINGYENPTYKFYESNLKV